MSAPKPHRRARSTRLRAVSLHGTELEISDHELIRPIGRGSYGEVWLARNILGGYRAAKFVERKAFSKSEPFEREFAGIKRFEPVSRTHPGLVSILHVGRNGRLGYFYCVMELADDAGGGALVDPEKYAPRTLAGDLTKRSRLPLGECLEIGLALADALAHLHRQGLIHRDIKPANIIFVKAAAKLADIGLVAAMSDEGTSLGTQGYVPGGEPASPAADIYALGMVLYEASAGKPPSRFPDLPTHLEGVADSGQFTRFNDVMLKACERDRQARFPTAEALSAALRRCKEGGGGIRLGPGITSTEAPRARRADRKLLTALGVHISGAGQADPEAWQSLMLACQERVRPIVRRYGGSLAPSPGDGLIATFGGAMSMEDHARRATTAALDIARELAAARGEQFGAPGFELAVRIGLNTGLAIATTGDERDAPVGEAVNLALRTAGWAEAGQVVMTADVWKVVKDYFAVRALGAKVAPGRAGPLAIYEVVAAQTLRTRLEAQAERGLTPYVGRRGELRFLAEKFALVKAGRGQVVLLAGEPGMGKSRLLLEFQRSLAGQDAGWLAGRAVSFGGQMAFLPIIDLLRRLFEIGESQDRAAMSDRIEAQTRELRAELEASGIFKHLLSLHESGESPPGMHAPKRRAQTFDALRKLLLARAATAPLVVVIEDLHWADKTSEEFLLTLADSLSMARLLLLVTYRTGHPMAFPDRSFTSRIMLQPLSDEESLALASGVLVEKAMPDEFRKLAVAKAEGNPFFLEEMVKSLVEAGASLAPARAAGAAPPIGVPETIQDVIMSRIDRLEESPRTTLQLASVIGREFSVNLLETIAALHEPLADSLQKLKDLELIYERALFPEHICFFKHALTQEVAYNSLLRQRRRELHGLVAAALEEIYAGRLPEFYELLAYHYERGEEWERALDYLRRAAEQCRRLGAYREEAQQLSRAMAIATKLGMPDLAVELRGRRGAARVKFGMITEAKPDLEGALAGLPSENRERRAELLLAMAGACFWGLDTSGTQRYSAEGHALAEQAGRQDLVAEGLTYLGAGQQSLGNLARATDFFEQARAKGGGSYSAALANYPLTLYLRGRLTEAAKRAAEATETFRGANDAFSANFGHPHLGLALAGCGRYAEAAAVFEEAKQMGMKHEIWHFRARAMAMSAGFHLDVFDFEGNERLAHEAREQARSAPFRPSEVSATIDLAFNAVRRGCVSRGEALAKEAGSLITQVAGWHEWLWRLRMKQVQAELACARQEWTAALKLASEAICASQAHDRLKYVAAGMETRARALAALGRKHVAITDLRRAIKLAWAMGDPALLLRIAVPLLAIAGDDALFSEARATARQILAALPSEEMRCRFATAPAIQSLGRF